MSEGIFLIMIQSEERADMRGNLCAKTVSVFIFTILLLIFADFQVEGSVNPEPAEQAAKELKIFVDKTIILIRNFPKEVSQIEREAHLYDWITTKFDWHTLSMLSLGRQYQNFSVQQRADFVKNFSKLIVHTYVSQLEGHDIEKVVIKYLYTTVMKATNNLGRVDVSTNILHEQVATPVVYRMLQNKDGHWKIYDVKIEGVSMVANYRDQFRQYISSPPEKIINDIKEKLKT